MASGHMQILQDTLYFRQATEYWNAHAHICIYMQDTPRYLDTMVAKDMQNTEYWKYWKDWNKLVEGKYRVFFLTGTPPKKYKQDRNLSNDALVWSAVFIDW